MGQFSQPRCQGLSSYHPRGQMRDPGNEVSILSVEQETIVENVKVASNCDYNHGTIIRIYME